MCWGSINFRLFSRSILLLLTCLIYSFAKGEGTKQLRPDSASNGGIQIYTRNGSGSTFAAFNGPENSRLNIRICNVGEVVYLGVSRKGDNYQMRVMSPIGQVVIGPKPTNVAPGMILSYRQAQVGPRALFGAAGYDALTFTATMTGDYYVEFQGSNANNVDPIFQEIDVTVTNNGQVKNGRLWSKAWMFNVNEFSNPFNATMYVYTDDMVTTKVNFNGIRPYEFIISSNSTGTSNTGNSGTDRLSVPGNRTYPLYKIFLNEPDTSCFETGFLGEIVGEATITGCPGNYCINVNVSAPGNMVFTIEANEIPGYQPNSADRLIQFPLKTGPNCVPWDGRNGLGDFLGKNATVNLSIQYINGLTHLPIFDVENHPNGYYVSYVRPKPQLSDEDITLFWDDRNINIGTSGDSKTNLAGCLSTSGCHKWSNRGDNGNCVRPGVCSETINTWWYVKESSAKILYNFSEKSIDANINTPGTGTDNDTSVCASTKFIQLKGGVSGDTISRWSIITGSGNFMQADSLRTVYTLSAADNLLAAVVLKISSVNTTNCPVIHDTIKINLDPLPVLNMPSPSSICSNNTTLNITAAVANVQGISWKGNGGKFLDSLKATIQYTPSKAEIESSKVRLYAFTLSQPGQLCPMIKDSVDISVFLPATLIMPSDTTLCFNDPLLTVPLTVKSVASDSVVWSSAQATLNPKRGLSTQINAANADSVKIFATAYKKGCNSIKDSVQIKFVKAPVINLPDKQCFYSPLPVTATVTNKPAEGAYVWKRNGVSLNATNPTIQATQPGDYSYHFEYKQCMTSDMISLISAARIVVPDTFVCRGSTVQLKARIIPGATYVWGGTSSSSPTYNFVTSGRDSVLQVISIDGNGCRDTTLVKVQTNPYPEFTVAGEEICPGEMKELKTTLTTPLPAGVSVTSYKWSADGINIPATGWNVLPYNKAGNYALELSAGQCTSRSGFIVYNKPSPKIDIPLTHKYCFETQSSVVLESNLFNTHSWYSEEGLLSNLRNITVAPLKDKVYFLKVENEFNCKDSAQITVKIVCPPRLFVPNVITPFSNDVNAGLEIFGAHYTNFEITVFSRWGEVIFNSKNPDHVWDGHYRNENMPIGNYPWIVTYEGDSEEYKGPYKKTGEVTVVR